MNNLNTIKLFLFLNKKKLIIISSIIFILTLSLIGYLKFNLKTKANNKVILENTLVEKKVAKKEENNLEYIYVDIKGNVENPGVYSLEKGKRVVDAINIAGGLKDNSDTSLLNLSMVLSDQMIIIVYSKDQIKSLEETIKKEKVKNSICNNIVKNDACIVNSQKEVLPNLKNNNQTSTDNDTSVASEKININTASKEILMTLSKIGESKAQAIIEYRETNGSFKTIEDIKNVNGIGDSLFEAIKNYITI